MDILELLWIKCFLFDDFLRNVDAFSVFLWGIPSNIWLSLLRRTPCFCYRPLLIKVRYSWGEIPNARTFLCSRRSLCFWLHFQRQIQIEKNECDPCSRSGGGNRMLYFMAPHRKSPSIHPHLPLPCEPACRKPLPHARVGGMSVGKGRERAVWCHLCPPHCRGIEEIWVGSGWQRGVAGPGGKRLVSDASDAVVLPAARCLLRHTAGLVVLLWHPCTTVTVQSVHHIAELRKSDPKSVKAYEWSSLGAPQLPKGYSRCSVSATRFRDILSYLFWSWPGLVVQILTLAFPFLSLPHMVRDHMYE